MTSDDICGAECADGTPCQHPAGSCPVADHAEPRGPGRPTKFNDERAREAIAAARQGLSEAGCGRAAGVSHTTIGRWKESNPSFEDEDGTEREFRAAFRRARNAGESRLIRDGLYDEDTDSSMAKFLLSTSFDYVKTERREVDADVEHSGEPIMVIERGDDSAE